MTPLVFPFVTHRDRTEGRIPWGIRTRLGAVVAVVVAAVAVGVVPAGPAGAVPLIGPRIYQGGGLLAYGGAQDLNHLTGPLNSVMVGVATDEASTPGDQGLWLASADGGVFAEGSAGFYGSLGDLSLTGPIVAIASTPDGRGYWLAAADGGVFAFGDAAFYGSMGGIPLNQPVVGMAATPDGRGYWLVASDGGIFSFGDAAFLGSMGGTPLVAPVVGMVATHHGAGYWMVAADGGLFAFGDAPFDGSEGGQPLPDPVVGMTALTSDGGYAMATNNGVVYPFGAAANYGDLRGGYGGDPTNVPPVTGIAFSPGGSGYWLLEPDGWSYSFANPGPPAGVRSTIVSVAAGQVGTDPDRGSFCNPYGPCEEWCALFATWVWQTAGIDIPSYAFTGDVYYWAADTTGVVPPWGAPTAGDAILYGTGPQSTATSVHMGIVVQRWPDGAIVTVEGDAGPGTSGSLAVVVNGPFFPDLAPQDLGFGVYAYAQP